MSSERVQAVLDAYAALLRGEPADPVSLYRQLTTEERQRVVELLLAEGDVTGRLADEVVEEAQRRHREQQADPTLRHEAEIRALAAEAYAYQEAYELGLVPEAEFKAYQARHAERLAELDQARGIPADVTYAQFREAFDAGADCGRLFELKNAMHPKDPLKEAAIEDLRSVGCYSPRHERRAES